MQAEAMRPVAGQSAPIPREIGAQRRSNGDTQQPQHTNRPTPNGMSQGYGSEVRDGIRLRYECVMLYERTRGEQSRESGYREVGGKRGIFETEMDYLRLSIKSHITDNTRARALSQ